MKKRVLIFSMLCGMVASVAANGYKASVSYDSESFRYRSAMEAKSYARMSATVVANKLTNTLLGSPMLMSAATVATGLAGYCTYTAIAANPALATMAATIFGGVQVLRFIRWLSSKTEEVKLEDDLIVEQPKKIIKKKEEKKDSTPLSELEEEEEEEETDDEEYADLLVYDSEE